ncbi:MAG: hypothetical protein K0M63_00895 [Weeksellaceae bacterium]|nr:hypothetical protein [Weeksellaceae bacterium]
MNKQNPYRKFQGQQDKIANLEKTNSRFRRVYSEYNLMSEELWNLETTPGVGVPDDFINSVQLQTTFLEDEIEQWLDNTADEKLE